MGTDTIAAIATAMTSSGIGIVRISGDEAVSITDRIFEMKNQKKLEDMPTHTIHYGHIHDGDEVIDEVMVVLMRGPKSYTREDTVEIDCHGGVYVMKRILETVIKYGARPAEPGEFTKRAFLNGRIDLSQAESVIDVINSKNEFALKSSLSQLSGSVSEKIKEIRGTVLHEIAFIESALDDAWNKGVKVAHGKWVAFIGADDTLLPNAIQNYLNAIRLTPVIDSYDYICAHNEYVDLNGKLLKVLGEKPVWSRMRKYMAAAHVASLHNISPFQIYFQFKMPLHINI